MNWLATSVFSIFDRVTPIAEVWMMLTIAMWIATAVLLARLICCTYLPFLALYLIVTLLSFARYHGWYVWLDALATIGMAGEALYHSLYSIEGYYQRYYRRLSAIGCGVALLGVAGFASSAAYVGYSSVAYFTRLYTMVLCAGALVGSLLFSWRDQLKPLRHFVWYTCICLCWMVAIIAAGLEHRRGHAWYVTGIERVLVQMTCIGLWYWRTFNSLVTGERIYAYSTTRISPYENSRSFGSF